MTHTAIPLELLACPRCGKAISASAEAYRCAGCAVSFPMLEGIPWLFPEPGVALGEWRERLNLLLKKLEHEAQTLAEALQSKALHELTHRRLEHVRDATLDHVKRMRRLLAPLKLAKLEAGYETYLALRTRLPTDQGLTNYYANIHRDWAWGQAENGASAEMVAAAIGAGDEPRKMLVLGAGAGRLAYDLHMRTATELTVALDFNPLLMLVAQHVIHGEQIELYEFPLAPRGAADTAVLRKLAVDTPVRDGFHLVLGNALAAPFGLEHFDIVVTPWLVDILPEDFRVLCQRINALLPMGGRWIDFGSLAFYHADPARNYSLEECAAIVEGAGFSTPAISEREIPYLCSPASRHGRRESVVAWAATKEKKTARAPRYQALPDWLTKGDEPVPKLPSFELQATSTRIYAYIMSLIDGQRSLKDMAKLMEEQRLMPRTEAEPAIRSFIIKMYEDAQRGSSF